MGSDRFGLRVVFVVGAMLLLVKHLAAEGIVISVNWQQNAVLLQSVDGFSLVAVDPAVAIDDLVGVIHTLRDLQPGDVIECQGESFGELLIAHRIRVISIWDDVKSDWRGSSTPNHQPTVIRHRHIQVRRARNDLWPSYTWEASHNGH